jgi:hypothetical protein
VLPAPQFRPALQVPAPQHGCPLSPQASQIRASPASGRAQTSLPAVQNLLPAPAPTVQQGSPEAPHEPASPTQAPAWQVPLLPGQTESTAMQVPLAQQPLAQELSEQQPLPTIPQVWQMNVVPPPSAPAL